MKHRNTAIVQEPYLQDCTSDGTENISCSNKYFPEKIVDIVQDQYQDSDDTTDEKYFDKSEFEWEDSKIE